MNSYGEITNYRSRERQWSLDAWGNAMNLASATTRVQRSARLWRRLLRTPPGHYYSPVSGVRDADRAREQRGTMELDNSYDLRASAQIEFADLIGPSWTTFSESWRRYTRENEWYCHSDGAVYYSMLTTFNPKRIIEVGSGFSSAIALDTRDKQIHDAELIFIEPYPDRLLSLLEDSDHAKTTLHQSALQDVPLETFDALEADDILFVDSTHVSKAGSDVNWLFFQVLPRLKPGVIIHIHDIHFPFEYIDSWLNEGRSWNELYMLRSFLSYNNAFQIVFFNSWVWQKHPEIVDRYLPETKGQMPGSIWLRRIA